MALQTTVSPSPPLAHAPEPVNTNLSNTDAPSGVDADAEPVVESPSLSTPNCLARFEFEPNRANDGTKVLMVEWADTDATRGVRGSWEVSWEGKKTVLEALEEGAGVGVEAKETPARRMFSLLPPGVPVPGTVTLRFRPAEPAGDGAEETVFRTHPLPAIFPPELGDAARQAGKKGVLHTLWAKRRLAVLEKEIEIEARNNVEGVGLAMAEREKEWIIANFGIGERKQSTDSVTTLPTPVSPRSPNSSGRLAEKLKGLRLETSSGSGASHGPSLSQSSNPLSPETSDVAVSSFAAFKGVGGAGSLASLAAKPPQPTAEQQQRKISAAVIPPPEVLAQQQRSGMASLDALAGGSGFAGFRPVVPEQQTDADADREEEDLFALPISPRSPEMGRSPFSFSRLDVEAVKGL